MAGIRGRIGWGAILVVTLLVVTTMVSSGQEREAPGSEPVPSVQHVSDPASLQAGHPLPGARYPWQPVERQSPVSRVPGAPPAGIDLDVTFIRRTPIYLAYWVNYVGGIPYLQPGTEGEQRWPEPGEVVTFTAHIANKGTQASPDFAYEWSIDGAAAATGMLPGLAAGAATTVTLAWPWGHTMDGERVVDDHTVGFVVDPADLIVETYEANNRLEDRTNALSFRLAITPEMVTAYDTPWDSSFSYSAEDWLQRQIVAMNWALANSTYPTTPGGATERVRIDQIVVTSTAPLYDRQSDGGWFVDADYRVVSGGYDPIADVDWNLVHELSHQVGLIDLYMSGIYETVVHVLDSEGGLANVGFAWPRPGLMGGGDVAPHTDSHLYSSHSAGGISSTKGYRRGYYGEYQYDIPAENYLQVLDSQGIQRWVCRWGSTSALALLSGLVTRPSTTRQRFPARPALRPLSADESLCGWWSDNVYRPYPARQPLWRDRRGRQGEHFSAQAEHPESPGVRLAGRDSLQPGLLGGGHYQPHLCPQLAHSASRHASGACGDIRPGRG